MAYPWLAATDEHFVMKFFHIVLNTVSLKIRRCQIFFIEMAPLLTLQYNQYCQLPSKLVIPEKVHTPPMVEIENNTSMDILQTDLRLPSPPPLPSLEGRIFLCGWGMDYFWYDPLLAILQFTMLFIQGQVYVWKLVVAVGLLSHS